MYNEVNSLCAGKGVCVHGCNSRAVPHVATVGGSGLDAPAGGWLVLVKSAGDVKACRGACFAPCKTDA
jgi:hypothetical protein